MRRTAECWSSWASAFDLAETDDTVRVVILRAEGPVLLRGPRSRVLRRRPRTHTRPGPTPHLSVQRRDVRRGGVAQPAGMALLLREHEAVAQSPQDHHRRGARDGPVCGPDAGMVLRSHRRRRGHRLRRRRRHPARDVWGRVLRPSVGVRPAQGKGAVAHRRLPRTPTKPTLSGWSARSFPTTNYRISTVEFARRIAKLPTIAALLIKESVNQTVDAMGFSTALDACFKIHQLNHAHWGEVTGGAAVIRHRRERARGLARLARDPARDQAATLRRKADTGWTSTTRPKRRHSAYRIRAFLAEHLPAGWSRGRRAPRDGAGGVRRSGGGGPSPAAAWSPCPGRRSTAARDFPRSNRWCWPRNSLVRARLSGTENDLLGIELLGNTLIALGSEAAEEAFPSPHLVRRRSLVPRLLRTRGRLGPGVGAHQGCARAATSG